METPIQLVFKNISRTPALVDAIEKKILWLEHFYSPIISCRVTLEVPHRHHHRGNLFEVKIDLRVAGEEIVSKCHSKEGSKEGSKEVSKDRAASQNNQVAAQIALHEAFDIARRDLEDYARRQRREGKRLEKPPHGRVIRLVSDESQYGFIETDDGRELYFHSNSVVNGQYDRLQIGTEVRYSEELGDKGLQASSVIISGSRSKTETWTNEPKSQYE